MDENVGVHLTIANLLVTNIIHMLQSSEVPRSGEINAYLRQQEKLIPGIRTFLVTDPRGRVILSNREGIIGYDAHDRDYFKVALAAGDGSLVISPPFKSVLGTYVVSISRVLTGHRGEFRGVVNASLDQEYFSNFLLSSVLYSPDNRVSLVHFSGEVYISFPDPQKIEGKNLGRSGSRSSTGTQAQRASMQRGLTAATGEDRILAFVTSGLPDLRVVNPLIVMAGRDTREVFAPWRRDLAVQAALYFRRASRSLLP